MGKEIITFGSLEGDQVTVFEFCKDPDGSGLQWFRPTGKSISIEPYQHLNTDQDSFSGRCVDTGEFDSHAGELLVEILTRAPSDAKLATVIHSSEAGTRTFQETVEVTFYS